MDNYLVRVGLTAGINLALLVPFLLFAIFTVRSKQPALKSVLLFAGFFVLDIGLLFSFLLVKFIPFWGGWPWQYKVLEIAGTLVLISLVPGFTASRIGLQFRTRPGSWCALLAWSILYVIVAVPLMLYSAGGHPAFAAKLPEYLFQATLPGIAEEFVYRGVLLSLLNEAFGRPWKLAGAPFGCGGVIIVALFGFLHGVVVGPAGAVHVYWSAMILTAIVGFVLTWLKERSDSVWPGVVFHNLVNVLNSLFG